MIKEHHNTIPLGGIGSGFLRLNRYGRFSNHIPTSHLFRAVLPFTFPCIRLQTESGVRYLRALCFEDEHDQNLLNVPEQPRGLKQDDYQFTFRYPEASFQLCDPEAPACVTWSYFSPIIPYDHVAATMPVLLLGIRVENTSAKNLSATVLLNMDNIIPMHSDDSESVHRLIHAIRISSDDEMESQLSTNVFRGSLAEMSPELLQEYGFNALLFGERRKDSDSEPYLHCCLAANEHQKAKIRAFAHNPSDPYESQRFWHSFESTGKLPPVMVTSEGLVGSLASSIILNAGQAHRFEFAIAWYMPDVYARKQDLGSGYTHTFKSASDAAKHALKHLGYFFSAVENWQKPLMNTDLPSEFGKALGDCCRIFTTHTRYAPDGGFMFVSDAHTPPVCPARWSFFSAFATLLFTPHFHTIAVTKCLNLLQDEVGKARFADSPERLCEVAELFLSTYADVVFLGHRARMAEWFPKVLFIIDAILGKNADDYGSSSRLLARFSLKGLGLWAVALKVINKMAGLFFENGTVPKYQKAASIFAVRYETELLNATRTGDKLKHGVPGNASVAASAMSPMDLTAACCARLLEIDVPPALFKILTLSAGLLEGQTNQELSLKEHMIQTLATLTYGRSSCGAYDQAKMQITALAGHYFREIQGPENGQKEIASEALSLWAVLQVLAGFCHDALNQSVILHPAVLPEKTLLFPIFSPVSLGSITLQKESEKPDVLSFHLTLETPLTIRTLILCLPESVNPQAVSCVLDSDTISFTQEITRQAKGTRILLIFKTPLKMAGTFSLRLRQ